MSLVTNVVSSPTASRLLLLVHGLGADEHDLEGLLPYLDPAGLFVAVLPRAPYSLGGAMPGYGWFDFGGPDGVDRESYLSSVDALDRLVDEACSEHGFRRSEAVVAGFSQGAAMALALAYRRSDRVRPAAVLAMSGFLPQAPWLPLLGESDGIELPPALVQHGSHDPLVAPARGQAVARDLTAMGAPVVYREYPMQHQVA
ncbi:MAG: alpha/beta hydrolase, partial [Actinomycetota bacterium]